MYVPPADTLENRILPHILRLYDSYNKKTDYYTLHYTEMTFKIGKVHVLFKVKLIFIRVSKIE